MKALPPWLHLSICAGCFYLMIGAAEDGDFASSWTLLVAAGLNGTAYVGLRRLDAVSTSSEKQT